MKLIGIAGNKNCGKDTISNMFVESEKFTKLAFADSLKELLVSVFRVESKYFEDRRLKEAEFHYITIDYSHLDKIRSIVTDWGYIISREQREKLEELFNQEIKTPRELMQTIGNKLRQIVRDDIWILQLYSKMTQHNTSNFVISDVRYSNEREALKKAGAQLILIKRAPLVKDSHISENDFGKENEYDVVIKNDDISIQDLKSEVLMWYSVKMKYR